MDIHAALLHQLSVNKTLEAELSAMTQRAEAVEQKSLDLAVRAMLAEQRAEATEARIKASQEQEPIGYYGSHINGHRFVSRSTAIAYGHEGRVPVYVAPVIPPDVAELQRENAELTKLLAEAKSKAVPE